MIALSSPGGTMRFALFSAGSILVACVSVSHEARSASVPVLESVDDQLSGVLANGVRYTFVSPREFQGPTEIRLIVRSGFLDEGIDEMGATHLIEHLGFAGIPSYPGDSLWTFLQGRSPQAFTGYNSTVYRFSLERGDAATPDEAMQILAEISGDMTLADASIDKERAAVLAEAAPDTRSRHIAEKARLVRQLIGSVKRQRLEDEHRTNVRSIPATKLRAVYRRLYTADRFSVVVVGPIDKQVWYKAFEKRFSRFKSSNTPQVRNDITPELSKKNRFSLLTPEKPGSLQISAYSFVHADRPEMDGDRSLKDYLTRKLAEQVLRNRLRAIGKIYDLPLSGSFVNRNLIDPTMKFDGVYASSTLDTIERAPEWSDIVRSALRDISKKGMGSVEFERIKAIWRVQLLGAALEQGALIDSAYVMPHVTGDNVRQFADVDLVSQTYQSINLKDVNKYLAERINLKTDFHIICQCSVVRNQESKLTRDISDKIDGSRKDYFPIRHVSDERPLPTKLSLANEKQSEITRYTVSKDVVRYSSNDSIPLFVIKPPPGMQKIKALVAFGRMRRPKQDPALGEIESFEGQFAFTGKHHSERDVLDYLEAAGISSGFETFLRFGRFNISGNLVEDEKLFDVLRGAVASSRQDPQVSYRNGAHVRYRGVDSVALSDGKILQAGAARELALSEFKKIDPTAVILIGTLAGERAEALYAKYISDIKTDGPTKLLITERHRCGPFSQPRRQAEAKGEPVGQVYSVKSCLTERQRSALMIASAIINNQLFDEFRVRLGKSYYAGGGIAVDRMPDADGMSAVKLTLSLPGDEADRAELSASLEALLKKVLKGSFSNQELNRAKQTIVEGLEDPRTVQSWTQDVIIRNYLHSGRIDSAPDPRQTIMEIEIDDVKNAMAIFGGRV